MTQGQFPRTSWSAPVLRLAGSTDFSLGGISAQHERIKIVRIFDKRYDPNGVIRWEADRMTTFGDEGLGVLVLRSSFGPYWHLEPFVEHMLNKHGIFGGNHADLGWQFDDVAKRLNLPLTGPGARIVGVHDRYETR